MALAGSLVAGLAGLWWLVRPSAYPFGPADRFHDLSLMVGVSARDAGVLLLVSAAVSGPVAAARLRRRPMPDPLRIACVGVATAMAVGYGYLLPDIQILIIVAYALTLGLPAIVVFILTARREVRRPDGPDAPSARGPLVAGAATFAVTVACIVALGRPWEWGDGGEAHAPVYRPLVLLGSVLVGAAWAVVAVRGVRELRGACVICGVPGPAWTTPESAARWGRVVTWGAALTPLPYVVARLTWLTPWPYGESTEHLADHPALWVFGLGLAAAGELGTWLTLGLVRPRGEVFPRWLPVWGGRSVPVLVAVVPGFCIALLMCIGGHSVVQQAFGPGTTWEDHSLVVLVPLPLWGPLLGLGTLAYWYRRRDSADRQMGARPWPAKTGRHGAAGETAPATELRGRG